MINPHFQKKSFKNLNMHILRFNFQQKKFGNFFDFLPPIQVTYYEQFVMHQAQNLSPSVKNIFPEIHIFFRKGSLWHSMIDQLMGRWVWIILWIMWMIMICSNIIRLQRPSAEMSTSHHIILHSISSDFSPRIIWALGIKFVYEKYWAWATKKAYSI